uniref:Uncharacterized protein n=1 Tax=Romanomermis culicivorax TaxID=13658 RepID=A0A915KXT4_ROMCU
MKNVYKAPGAEELTFWTICAITCYQTGPNNRFHMYDMEVKQHSRNALTLIQSPIEKSQAAYAQSYDGTAQDASYKAFFAFMSQTVEYNMILPKGASVNYKKLNKNMKIVNYKVINCLNKLNKVVKTPTNPPKAGPNDFS